jgi:hypothetical protein
MLCLSYYCLCSVFNKIRDKGRTVSAWKRGGRGGEGKGDGKREGVGFGGEMTPTLHAHVNKQKRKRMNSINKTVH